MSLKKSLIRSSVARNLQFFLQIIITFVMMPFIIHSLGERMYGVWTLVGTFIGYYGLLDLGLASSVTRYVSQAIGKNDHKEISIIVNTSFFLFSLVGCLILCITFTATIFADHFFQNAGEIVLLKKIIIILGINIAIGFPARVFSGVLTSFIRHDLSALATIVKSIISSALIFIFLKRGHGVLAMAYITFFASIIEYLLIYFFSKKIFSHLRLTHTFVNREKIKLLFNYSYKSFIASLADILRFRIDPFVIAGFLDVGLVTFYSVASRLNDYFIRLTVNTVGIMAPVFSQYEGQNDYDSIREKFFLTTKISTIIAVFVGTNIIIFGKVFIQRWMGPRFDLSYQLTIILCVPTIIALMQTPTIGVLRGISKHHFFAISNSLEGLTNLILTLILVKYYGVYGVAMATAAAMAFFKIAVQPVYICKILKISPTQYFVKTLIWTLIKTLIPVFIFVLLFYSKLKADYLNIIFYGSIQLALFIPFLWLIILTKKEKLLFMEFLPQKHSKKRQ